MWLYALTSPPTTVRPAGNYVLHKEILWESDAATDAEVTVKEVEFIRQLRPKPARRTGYDPWPPPGA